MAGSSKLDRCLRSFLNWESVRERQVREAEVSGSRLIQGGRKQGIVEVRRVHSETDVDEDVGGIVVKSDV